MDVVAIRTSTPYRPAKLAVNIMSITDDCLKKVCNSYTVEILHFSKFV